MHARLYVCACVKQSGGEEEEDEAGSGGWEEEWSERERKRETGWLSRARVKCECLEGASMGVFIAAPKQRRDFFTIRRNIVAETLNFYPPERQRRAGSRLCLATGGSTPVHARI